MADRLIRSSKGAQDQTKVQQPVPQVLDVAHQFEVAAVAADHPVARTAGP